MAFKDYSITPALNTTLGDGTYIGTNMLRNKVRPAFQQIAADGKELYDLFATRISQTTGPQGAPGANVEAIGPFASLTTMTVPAGTKKISSAEAYSGQGAGPAHYVEDTDATATSARGDALITTFTSLLTTEAIANAATVATDNVTALEARVRRSDATGRKFRIDSDHPITPAQVRLAADTDHSNLQAWADLGTLYNYPLKLPAKLYTIAEPLFLTHGKQFFATNKIVGSGAGYDPVAYQLGGTPIIGGTVIQMTAGNKPALVIQGARNVTVSQLQLTGPLRADAVTRGLGDNASTVDDSLPASWETATVAERQWAVSAGIAVDPLADAAPATPYPTFNGEAAYWGTAQYNRSTSSSGDFDNVSIEGFNTGIVTHPGQGASQTDFFGGKRVAIRYCKWGLSVGNTQARNMSFERVDLDRTYCGFTNRQHGEKNGKFSCLQKNWSFSNGIMCFDVSASSSLTGMDEAYVEAMHMIGIVAPPAARSYPVIIANSDIQIKSYELYPKRGTPVYEIASSSGFENAAGVTSINSVYSPDEIMSWATTANNFDNCAIFPTIWNGAAKSSIGDGAAPSFARALAHNGSAGLAIAKWARPRQCEIATGVFNLDSLAFLARSDIDANGVPAGTAYTNRQVCIPWWQRSARPRFLSDDRYNVNVPVRTREINKPAGMTVSGRTITGNFGVDVTGNSGAIGRYQSIIQLGRLAWDSADGRVWYVSEVDYTTGVATFTALKGFYSAAATPSAGVSETLKPAFNNATGTFLMVETGFYTPSDPLIADFTSGSATATNVRSAISGNASSAFAAGEINAGDYLHVDKMDGMRPFAFDDFNSRIASLDYTARTITFAGTSLVTRVGHRLDLFVRVG